MCDSVAACEGTQYAWANSQRLHASLAAAGIGYWPGGSKDPSEEDYGPDWPAVRELDEGHFTYGARPSTQRRHRFLGINLGVWRKMCTDNAIYDVTWLPPVEAAAAWRRLGLTDRNF
ncbi:hypothetical protein FB459_1890 [Yimella lutea]|uniref:Uncharacterized protein n=1 Tax=Yimella lutea TaxID=587872 RepID=A0A542EGI9_9MICO|nr:hypothetical protein [Yimella lutea]TQJ14430.1 hypothetical protein FB459_1890 [Yimella lutea]